MLKVISAEYVEGYKIRVSFNTDQTGIVDLSDALWGPVFERLKDPDVFARLKVSDVFHTVCWENGADFAPEFLRDKMMEQSRASDTTAPRH